MDSVEIAILLIPWTLLFIGLAFEIPRLKAQIKDEILGQIAGLRDEIIKDPEKFTKTIEPVLQSILKTMMSEGSKEIQNQIPMIKLPIIGKIPASMLEPFLGRIMGKMTGTAQDEGKGPFG